MLNKKILPIYILILGAFLTLAVSNTSYAQNSYGKKEKKIKVHDPSIDPGDANKKKNHENNTGEKKRWHGKKRDRNNDRDYDRDRDRHTDRNRDRDRDHDNDRHRSHRHHDRDDR